MQVTHMHTSSAPSLLIYGNQISEEAVEGRAPIEEFSQKRQQVAQGMTGGWLLR